MDPSKEEYAAFLEKVKRTVYIDNLSPSVTDKVLKTALDQFVTVVNIEFIPNYLEETDSQAALVETRNANQADHLISDMSNFPFMVVGMPRPVRVRPAKIEMFDDRPRKPGRKIVCRWLDPKDPDFEVAKEMKKMVQKHAAEASFLLQQQVAEEEKLAKQQEEILKANYKKYELTESVLADGTVKKLGHWYNVNIPDA